MTRPLALLCLALTAANACAADDTKTLHDFFAAEWEYTMQRNPTWASQLGDRRWNDRWEEVSPAAIEAEHQHNHDALARLRKVDRKSLSPRDQLNYDLFEHRLTQSIRAGVRENGQET
jgi:uncharacterized protein (DUF885 family)